MFYIMTLLPQPLAYAKGGEIMELVTSFFVSVAAGIISYYICKWLDRHKCGKTRERP